MENQVIKLDWNLSGTLKVDMSQSNRHYQRTDKATVYLEQKRQRIAICDSHHRGNLQYFYAMVSLYFVAHCTNL